MILSVCSLCRSFLPPLFFLISFPGFLQAQTDTLYSKLSAGYDVERRPNYDGYLYTVQYGKKLKFGTALATFQEGSRFNQTGWTAQAECYPKFGKSAYGYASFTATNGKIALLYSAAASWCPILKGGVELEIGGRMIYVSPREKVWLGGLGMTKYWKNWFFSPKLTLVTGKDLSGQAIALTVRRYGGDDATYLFFNTGVSKTNQTTVYQNLLFNTFQLNSRWLSAGVHRKINRRWAADFSAGFEDNDTRSGEVKKSWLSSLKLNYNF